MAKCPIDTVCPSKTVGLLVLLTYGALCLSDSVGLFVLLTLRNCVSFLHSQAVCPFDTVGLCDSNTIGFVPFGHCRAACNSDTVVLHVFLTLWSCVSF